MTIPVHPKVYHIAHIDRLPSIIADEGFFSDAQMASRPGLGTMIGMSNIKRRRLEELTLTSHPTLYVGQCVPFYLCSRSIMLYILSMRNHSDLTYKGGQDPIVHFELDMRLAVQWANQQGRKWAFTTSNAGSRFFEDYDDLANLDKIDWTAIRSSSWGNCKDAKQSEFLVEESIPWSLVERIGVYDQTRLVAVNQALNAAAHRPVVEMRRNWYY